MKYILLIVLAGIIGAQSHRLPRAIENNPLMIILAKQTAEIESQCKNVTGSDEAFNNFGPLINKLTVCVTSLYNVEEIIEKYNSTFSGQTDPFPADDFQELAKDVCPKRSGVFTCLEEFVETAVSPCLRANELENLNMVLKSYQSLSDYLCYNNAERIAQFFDDGGVQCSKDIVQLLPECVTAELMQYAIQHQNMNLLNTEFSKELCDITQQYHQCLVNKFKKCEKQSISELVAGVVEVMAKESKCVKYENEI